MSDNRLIRLISSKDHDISRDELVEIIRRTGTDRYDADRKHIFYDHYGKHDFDFFAEKSNPMLYLYHDIVFSMDI